MHTDLPNDELNGLTSQMRRAAVSVASNIAEGKGRYSPKEFVQFLYRARGSLLEPQAQLFIARELNYLESLAWRKTKDEADELGRILKTTSVQNSPICGPRAKS
jgi:four helix bundle protein